MPRERTPLSVLTEHDIGGPRPAMLLELRGFCLIVPFRGKQRVSLAVKMETETESETYLRMRSMCYCPALP